MKNKNFLTVQEACFYSSKSEKTIRNLIKTFLVKNESEACFTSRDTKKVLVNKKGKKFFYLISKSFLDLCFSSKNRNSENFKKSDTSKVINESTSKKDDISEVTSNGKSKSENSNYLDLLLTQYKTENNNLMEMIKTKDEQIKNFQERQRENNILIKDLHNQIKLPEEKKKVVGVLKEEGGQGGGEKETESEQKKESVGFWSGLFS